MQHRQQVGVMLNGTTVDGVVFGGPAYNSKKIVRGDVIREVNAPIHSKDTKSTLRSRAAPTNF